jgi:hypothetical protein
LILPVPFAFARGDEVTFEGVVSHAMGRVKADLRAENNDPSEPDLVRLPTELEVDKPFFPPRVVRACDFVGDIARVFGVSLSLYPEEGPAKDDGRVYGLAMACILGLPDGRCAPVRDTVES